MTAGTGTAVNNLMAKDKEFRLTSHKSNDKIYSGQESFKVVNPLL